MPTSGQKGLDERFMNAYKIERQTTFGKQFSNQLSNQHQYNAFYYTRKENVGGSTGTISSITEF